MDASSSLLNEEQKLQTEAKYKAYTATIDKALKNFEYSSEWADLISALGKLNKAISSNTQYQIIPRRIKISKRLAQCMHPALPSGVHLKALESYEVIFSKTGLERLATELFIYSSGLFPLLSYAAMNVRPHLLAIYEKFFVPLGDKLRPALSGFLSGVIPGYEAGLDHFERTNSLLSQVCAAVDPAYFYTCLWECVSTNASIRLPAISYLLDHFNRKLGMQDQLSLMGKNHEVMMAGLCACLNDPVILVQRNTLEFLLIGFPMHTTLLGSADFTRLVTNGLNTILRRDMSLNRRLYAWLLGTEVAGKRAKDHHRHTADSTIERVHRVASYFDQHSKRVLIRALRCTLKQSLSHRPVDLTPYKILVSLLDKVEIGPVVLDHVLVDVVRAMANARGNDDVMRSANLLFATFDPAYIWNFMTLTYGRACRAEERQPRRNVQRPAPADDAPFMPEVDSGDAGLVEVCRLTEFLLESISLEMYPETTRVYLPRVFLAIIQMLTAFSEHLSADEVAASLRLCNKIVSRVQPMIQPNEKQRSQRPLSEGTKLTGGGIGDDGDLGGSLEKSKSDSKINQISATVDPSMPSAVSTPDLDTQISNLAHKKIKSKRFSPSMKLRNLKGRSTPDIKQDDQQPRSESLTASSAAASPSNATADASATDGCSLDASMSTEVGIDAVGAETPASSAQEFSIVEQCIRQYEEFYHIYVSRTVLNIQNSESRSPAECSVLVQLIGETPSTPSTPKSTSSAEMPSGDSQRPPDESDRPPDADSPADADAAVQPPMPSDDLVRDCCPSRLPAIGAMFDTLRLKEVSRSQRLHQLLHKSLSRSSAECATDASGSSSECASPGELAGQQPKQQPCDERTDKLIYRLMNLKLSEPVRQAVRLACNLLVEMSTFPSYAHTLAMDAVDDCPAWLQVLALVACYGRCDRQLQLTAIATLFELVTLVKSQLDRSTGPGVTFVLMIPLLQFGHVHYIETRTRVLQVITSTLWDCLDGGRRSAGGVASDPAQIAALLYQLHSSDRTGLIERVIGHRMANTHAQWSDGEHRLLAADGRCDRIAGYRSERLNDVRLMCTPPLHAPYDCDALLADGESQRFRKFEVLWEYGREQHQQNAGAAVGFEKTLLAVFDLLALPCHLSIRTLVSKWLQESLLRGDMHRLVCPLMRILFASGTKRISVKHAHVIRREAVKRFAKLDAGTDDGRTGAGEETDGDERCGRDAKDVYAISSEDGHVKYHNVKDARDKKRSPMRTLQKRFFGVSLGTKSSAAKAQAEAAQASAVAAVAATNGGPNISLTVNPLDSSSDLDAWESETGSPVGSAPTALNAGKTGDGEPVSLVDDSMHTASGSLKEDDYYSSCEEETDDSYSETDSETRDPDAGDGTARHSLSSVATATAGAGDIKRFSGDCERVTEMLSQHDRTKNRKQYQVTKSGLSRPSLDRTDGSGPPEIAEGVELCPEATTPVDEYFNSLSSSANGTHLTDGTSVSLDALPIDGSAASLLGGGPADSAGASRSGSFVRSSKHRRRRNTSESSQRVPIGRDASNRLSCASKASTDSNRSRTSTRTPSAGANGGRTPNASSTTLANDSQSGGSDAEPTGGHKPAADERHNFDSVDSGVGLTSSQSTGAATASAWTRNRASVVEKSTRNADILRRSAAADGQFIRRSNLSLSDRRRQFDRLHPYHTHMLLYFGVYDTKQVLYTLQTLRNIIACDCRTFLYFSMTTSVPSQPLRQLLVRHRKSMLGKGFAGPILNTEFGQAYRGCMYLDVLFTVCLYYARSFFQKNATGDTHRIPTGDDIAGNCTIQLASIELLTLLCTELVSIVKDMGKQLACYIHDLLAKCKLQKIILHCVLSCVHSFQPNAALSFTEQLVAFNELTDDRLFAESLQIQLLRLLSAIIKLEYEVTALKGDDVPVANKSPNAGVASSSSTSSAASAAATAADGSPTRAPSSPNNVKYLPNCPISQQPMFLSAVLKALQSDQLRTLHGKWNDLITSSLNCFTFGSLTNIVISVIHQLCANVDQMSRAAAASNAPVAYIPPDYVLSQVQAIAVLCHYCLLDNSQPASLSHLLHQAVSPLAGSAAGPSAGSGALGAGHSGLSAASQAAAGQPGGSGAPSAGGQLLHNIVHAILSPPHYVEQQTRNAQLLAARNAVLSHLPVIVASVARLCDTAVGQTRAIRQQIIEFLSPVFRQHGTNFLAAVAVSWQERGIDALLLAAQHGGNVPATPTAFDTGVDAALNGLRQNSAATAVPCDPAAQRALPQACALQMNLVRLVSSIRVMSMDSFVQTLHQVVKTAAGGHHPAAGGGLQSVEVSALELFYFYMRQTAPIQLADCWPSLLLLLRDGIALQPSAQFVVLAILNEFVLRSPQMPFTDRRDLRDLHDVTARLVEALSNVAGARLEHTTWLRRNLAVKEDLPGDGPYKDHAAAQQQHQLTGAERQPALNASGAGGGGSTGGNASAGAPTGALPSTGNQAYSVQAQSVMAAVLANLLDVAYGYQDKDKVVTIITTLLYNVTPYLKNHTVRNVPSFRACSQLLANLSGYQYTRKAWRKDMVDLLLDPAFFQMDLSCLPFWKTILDNLMAYDNTTFRELMSRVSLTQTGGLNIFTSREQEYEQRAVLLKRLAFVIFCSEKNQYDKYMPDIQEQLANSLRLPSVVPAVQAAVFLCFRVLLLRMSTEHVTSLWPIIIAEMVQVFMAIEQELKSDSEEFSQHLRAFSGMDTPLTQHHLNHWRTVQLEASKLLELGCVLPATNLPHFQMFRWAFVCSQYETPSRSTSNGIGPAGSSRSVGFVPHVHRIARLMDLRFTTHSPSTRPSKGAFLTLTCQSIGDLQDLYAFYSTLGSFWPPAAFDSAERDVAHCLAEIETVLAADFLERMPTVGGTTAPGGGAR